MPIDLSTKKVVVTGGAGFLGKHVVKELFNNGCDPVVVRSAQVDLRDKDDVHYMYRKLKPDVVVHLAATVGGIGANQKHPGLFFYDNMAMGMNLIEEARVYGLEKFVQVGTVCAYPKYANVPFKEDDIWEGYPEETNAPYGIAKKALGVMLDAYYQEYGLQSAYVIPVNLYGPHDNFNPDSSHVIPALIKKIHEAKEKDYPSITCWGTGNASREFLHAADAAAGIVAATKRVSRPVPINLGSGKEISIMELVHTLARIMDYTGQIIFDDTKPDGQPRRCLDINRAKELLHWEAEINLQDGLAETVDWYARREK